MKKCFTILILIFAAIASYAQDAGDDKGGKIRDRMSEYIQDRLGLSRKEADRFSPVFFSILPGVQTNSSREQNRCSCNETKDH
jgi:hypothetical protein